MKQDLIDWLNGLNASSDRADKRTPAETGLLLAPLGTRPDMPGSVTAEPKEPVPMLVVQEPGPVEFIPFIPITFEKHEEHVKHEEHEEHEGREAQASESDTGDRDTGAPEPVEEPVIKNKNSEDKNFFEDEAFKENKKTEEEKNFEDGIKIKEESEARQDEQVRPEQEQRQEEEQGPHEDFEAPFVMPSFGHEDTPAPDTEPEPEIQTSVQETPQSLQDLHGFQSLQYESEQLLRDIESLSRSIPQEQEQEPKPEPEAPLEHGYSDFEQEAAALWTPMSEQEWEPDDQTQREEHEVKRGMLFIQKLHQILQSRKNRAAERQEPGEESFNYRPGAAVLCLVLLLFLGAACLVLRYLQNNSREYLQERAETLYREENYQEALDVYRRAYNRYPAVLSFLVGLARSAEKAGRLQTADVAWASYLNALPANDLIRRAQALYEQANVRAAQEDFDGAIACLNQSMRLDPVNYDAGFLLGRLLERQGRVREALQAYYIARDLRPSSPEAEEAIRRVMNIAESLTDLNLKPRTVPNEQQAQNQNQNQKLNKEPEQAVKILSTEALNNSGNLNTREPRIDSTLVYERQIETGTRALNLRRYEDALSCFTLALDIRSDDLRPWLGLAGAFQGLGARNEAQRILVDAREFFPKDPTIEMKLNELKIRN